MFSSKTVFKSKKMFFLIILIILIKFVHSLSKIYIYIYIPNKHELKDATIFQF